MSEKSPYQIDVEAQAFYMAEQSDADENHFVFTYRIRIRNNGSLPAKLISRHWFIRDLELNEQEVQGEGVVGEQPLIAPGQTFEYMSGTSLESPVGTMRGSYQMRSEDGTEFNAPIPEFILTVPRTLH